MPTPVIPPTYAQLCEWLNQLHPILAMTRRAEIQHDLLNVKARIERELKLGRTVEGGCAVRLLQSAQQLREAGVLDTSPLYDLAREIIQHENCPSPPWNVLLREYGYPPDPTGTEND